MITNTLYFYKGTAFPSNFELSQDIAMKMGKEQIAVGLRLSKLSLEEQAKTYLEQLDIIEACIFKHSKDGIMTRKTNYKVSKELNMSLEKAYAMWCVNICSLLVMKKLNNDNMNGFMSMQMSKKR